MLTRSGFTLIEALVVMAVLAVLYSLASPSFEALIMRWQSQQQTHLLTMALSHARETAIQTRQRVTLCPLSQQQCSNNWNLALTLFTDSNNNQKLDNHEHILRHFPAQTHRNATRNFNNYAISFNSQGQAGFATGSLSYCMNNQYGSVFVIARTGRVRKSSSFNSGQLPTLANGDPIPCPS